MGDIQGRGLVDGDATGDVVALDEPLSFWGGFDVATGRIIGRHPQAGTSLSGKVVVMPSGRGSSSSSSVLVEAIRAGTAPVALVLAEPDSILVLGALVAQELYGLAVPITVLWPSAYALVAAADTAQILNGGVVRIGMD